MSKIGIIGGSGLYDIEGIKNKKMKKLSTPFGEPSDEYMLGELEGKEVVFLPRHNRSHSVLPTDLNYRANIYGMKKLGVERIISISAVGSLRENLKPLDMVVPDQFVDRTNQARRSTFFGDGIVAHVSFADPVCRNLCDVVYNAGKKCGAAVHKGGTYINMEGPPFSTRAESILYRSWGMDIIGMTNMAEAKLAREAEMCFATLAMVTDYDCWYAKGHEDVNMDMVINNMKKNVEMAKAIIKKIVSDMPEARECECGSSLKHAIVTPNDIIPADTKAKLDIIIGKYIK
ncbi:MAG: S-methyl-5'-thioadenosine phosphorylase [Candidatus Omnitrophica bacterium]|nr:S-methyl-5'-thioadenosine phosphorylase [Candidatus Omnitrophota bacterium]MBU4487982.1 S-methyl-5'-thioadenosine phosphorylase [Candidatus Omnitrophota bacterium]MCG2704775.1 S-methyl-5'-thioadenosine phosphorylase [Candidatus Omnitrophota bacterium]